MEVKNQKTMNLAGWLAQAVEEAGSEEFAVVVIKKRGETDVAEWYALTRFEDLLELYSRGHPL